MTEDFIARRLFQFLFQSPSDTINWFPNTSYDRALGVLLFKSILFIIHVRNVKYDNAIIEKNTTRNKQILHQAQQIQKTMNSIENVVDWRLDDPRVVSEDLRQQFLMKTRTRRTPTSDRPSSRERVPLATTDFAVSSDLELMCVCFVTVC